jgi:hypothetical protein
MAWMGQDLHSDSELTLHRAPSHSRWRERNPDFELNRRLHWLAARDALSFEILQSVFPAEVLLRIHRDLRRELAEADARELALLTLPTAQSPWSPATPALLLQALEFEDREPLEWFAALNRALMGFQDRLLEKAGEKAGTDLEAPIRAHAHRFGTSQVPASLLLAPSRLPEFLCSLDSPLPAQGGPLAFTLERLTSKDLRFSDRLETSSLWRRIRRIWIESLCRALFPGAPIDVESHEDVSRTRYRIHLDSALAQGKA